MRKSCVNEMNSSVVVVNLFPSSYLQQIRQQITHPKNGPQLLIEELEQ